MSSSQKIKIALVIESLDFGGREKVLIEVANGLNAQQYEVHVITFSNNNNKQALALNSNVQLHALPFKNKDLVTPYNIFKAPFIVRKFAGVLKTIGPDIVHTHFLYQLLFLSAISIKIVGITMAHFHTIHTAGLYYTEAGAKNAFILKAEKLSVKINHACLIAVSKQLEEIALKFFTGSAAAICCIINGVNEKRFDFNLRKQCKKPDWGFDGDTIIVTYVARFDKEQKDHLTLLKAWQLIAANSLNVKLCLAGEGDYKLEAQQFVNENNLTGSVVFTGNIPNVNELLAVTDIGVFASRYEGLSVALLEKMFMKLPVIATNIPAFSSVVEDNKSALLFQPGDYRKLSENLILLINNKMLRYTIGENAYNAVKKYTVKNMVIKHDEYYRKNIPA